ncbi:DoxX family protein [Methylocystis heyeri]|uniref:DoxX family membrane protein n=1 Tax=Methylocystis heyeri TaxID=391905 RepID=A0A6B8KJM1_9HYPH|nr:DoxX family protein [Methylocystis heyeri]QGM47125.1 DoxX family membrane protein [Methylocystis heyeri]
MSNANPPPASLTDRIDTYADAMVRAAAGLILMPHGAQKLFGWFGGSGLAAAENSFQTKLGLPGWLAVAAGIVEFFGGLALALGLGTRVAAALIAAQMFFIVFAVHWSAGFFAQKGGFEYPLLWGVVALSYAIRGGGHCSLDAELKRRA